MKNSIHFFGDSFTEGHALHRTEYIWPILVCKALKNYKCKNHGEGAASPLTILKKIINQLGNIKPGDIVIVFETIPDRIEIYSPQTKKVISLTNAELVQAIENKHHKSFDSYNDIISAFNFVYDHRFKRLSNFEKYFRDIYIDLGNYLTSIGTRFILLPFHLSFGNIKDGSRFETVTKQTNGKYRDDHFSTKGHWQFANYVLESNFKDYQELKEPTEKLLI